MRIVSRCGTVDEFLDAFSRFIDETTLFICTRGTARVGDQRRFAITLKDGTPALRGDAVIDASGVHFSSEETSIGIRLRILKLSPDSLDLHQKLLQRRADREVTQVDRLPPPPPSGLPRAPATVRMRTSPGAGPLVPPPTEAMKPLTPAVRAPVIIKPRTNQPEVRETAPVSPPPESPPIEEEADTSERRAARPRTWTETPQTRGSTEEELAARVPPSEVVVPANPLSDVGDDSLRALVECVLYEDELPPRTEPDDLVTPRPILLPRPAEAPPAEQVSGELPGPARQAIPTPIGDESTAIVAAPPAILHVPGPPMRVSVGIGNQLVTAILSIAVGIGIGYLLFGTDLLVDRGDGAQVAPVAAATTGDAAPPVRPAPPADAAPVPAVAAVAVDAGVALDAGAPACTASLDVSPDEASVAIDGAAAGAGSLTDVAVPCDRAFAVHVKHPKFDAFEQSFTATAGTPLTITAHLVPRAPRVAPRRSRVRLVSTPPGAILTVDGKVVGRSPTTVTRPTRGTIFVTATLKGYKVWTRQVRVNRPTITVDARLDAAAIR